MEVGTDSFLNGLSGGVQLRQGVQFEDTGLSGNRASAAARQFTGSVPNGRGLSKFPPTGQAWRESHETMPANGFSEFFISDMAISDNRHRK
jgi:hypothetical protein